MSVSVRDETEEDEGDEGCTHRGGVQVVGEFTARPARDIDWHETEEDGETESRDDGDDFASVEPGGAIRHL